jgi:hypothetical protein
MRVVERREAEMSTPIAAPGRAVVVRRPRRGRRRLPALRTAAWSVAAHTWGAWPLAYGSELVARELRH